MGHTVIDLWHLECDNHYSSPATTPMNHKRCGLPRRGKLLLICCCLWYSCRARSGCSSIDIALFFTTHFTRLYHTYIVSDKFINVTDRIYTLVCAKCFHAISSLTRQSLHKDARTVTYLAVAPTDDSEPL